MKIIENRTITYNIEGIPQRTLILIRDMLGCMFGLREADPAACDLYREIAELPTPTTFEFRPARGGGIEVSKLPTASAAADT